MLRHVSFSELLLHAALLLGAGAVAIGYWHLAGSSTNSSTSMLAVADIPQDAQFDRHQVILFVSPTCTFCHQSMPFYASIHEEIESLRAQGNSLAFVAVITPNESRRAQRHAFVSHNISVDTLLALPLPDLGVDEVPMGPCLTGMRTT